MIHHSFVRFALVGLANTVFGYAIILILHYSLGFGPIVANVGGYLIGAALSYGLNRRFTFDSNSPHAKALPRFGLAVLACFLLNLLVLKLGLSLFALPVGVAQAIAVGCYTIAFYLCSRFLVFPDRASR